MKIGFLAISGVRVVDPALQNIGINLPGFIERSKVIASLPSLGLLTLAGLTPDHYQLNYVEVPTPPALLPGPFDIVAISSFSAMIDDAYALADRYRAEGTTVVMGGLHVTMCPEEASQHADAIVIGEGESVWPQLLKDFEAGALKKQYCDPKPFDLALAPMPRFDLLEIERYNRLTLQTSRDCPWNCEFCASSIRLQAKYRTKPVDKIMQELQAIKEIWSEPFIEFADDNTFVHKKHSHELMDRMVGQGIKWFTETDISVADDDALLRKMQQAGCAQILIGFEDPGLGTDGIELKTNWKAKQQANYLGSIKKIQDHGITVNGCFVVGLDTHTTDSFDDLWDFIQKSGLYEIQLTLMTPFPGTPLYARLAKENRLLPATGWQKQTLFDITYQPKQMSVDELHQGFLALAEKVYSQECSTQRKRNFMKRKIDLKKMGRL